MLIFSFEVSKVSDTVQKLWFSMVKVQQMVSSQISRMLTEEILRNSYSVLSNPVAILTLSRSQSPTQNSTSKLPTTIETTKLAVVLQNPMTMEFLQFMPQTQLITTPTTSDVDGNVFKNAWSWPRHPQAPQLPH